MTDISATEIETLRAENWKLKAMLYDQNLAQAKSVDRLIVAFGLTVGEARLLDILSDRKLHETRGLAGAVTANFSMKTVTVRLCKIRKKLAAKGLTVRNVHGHGYILPPETAAAIAAQVKA